MKREGIQLSLTCYALLASPATLSPPTPFLPFIPRRLAVFGISTTTKENQSFAKVCVALSHYSVKLKTNFINFFFASHFWRIFRAKREDVDFVAAMPVNATLLYLLPACWGYDEILCKLLISVLIRLTLSSFFPSHHYPSYNFFISQWFSL